MKQTGSINRNKHETDRFNQFQLMDRNKHETDSFN